MRGLGYLGDVSDDPALDTRAATREDLWDAAMGRGVQVAGTDRQAVVTTVGRLTTWMYSPLSMTTIVVMSDATLSLAEIKKRLSEIVDRVEQHHERVVLTRNGRPAAVILSPDDLESLEETLDILSDPSALAEIRRSQEEIGRG
ncbi:MAG: type II toxin-antitoxin system Phd/YefM family antitoxin, partial [Acidimicrobiia bacterium]